MQLDRALHFYKSKSFFMTCHQSFISDSEFSFNRSPDLLKMLCHIKGMIDGTLDCEDSRTGAGIYSTPASVP